MTKKTLIKAWIVMVIACVMSFSDWSFAAEWDNFVVLGYSLNYIVAVLSWIWILFAKLAGTFLTNNWVYGEILSIDTLLWRYWNVMKNIANFWLWFYFLYVIFKWLINQWKEDITKKLKDILVWLLVAWVWIQASWFFVAAIVDVSTITLSAVGSFPAQVISQSSYIEWWLRKTMETYLDPSWNYVETGTKLTLFSKNWNTNFLETSYITLDHKQTFTGLLDALMPDPKKEVSGPLYYIWFFVLKTNVINSINTSSEKWIKATILNTVIQWWTTIIFAIEMMVLCILAIMRIVYLWMFIILSPIAVLLRCIKKSWQSLWDEKSFLPKMYKQINFSSFFVNVFKPTIIVLWFWVAMLFVTLMRGIVIDSWSREINVGWTSLVSVPDGKAENPWDQKYTISMNNDFLGFTLAKAWKTFMEMILSIITVLLVYFILKFAVKFGGDWKSDFVSKSLWKVQDKVWDLMGSLPVMPVSGYDEKWKPTTHYINASNVFGLWGTQSLALRKMDDYTGKLREQNQKDIDIVKSWFSDNTWYLSEAERTTIKNKIEQTGTKWWEALVNVREEIKKIRTEEWKWMTFIGKSESSIFWIEQFKKWLEKMDKQENNIPTKNNYVNYWQKMIRWWNSNENKAGNLSDLFTNPEFGDNAVKAYVDFFFEGENSNIKSWQSLVNADISKSGGGVSWGDNSSSENVSENGEVSDQEGWDGEENAE